MNLKKLVYSLKLEIGLVGLGVIFSGVFTTLLFGLQVMKYYDAIYRSMIGLQSMIQEIFPQTTSIYGCFYKLLFQTDFFANVFFFFGLFCAMHVLHFCSGLLLSVALPKFNCYFKKMAFTHALNLPLNYFHTKSPGDIEKNVTNFAESFCQLVEFSLSNISRISVIITSLCLCFRIKLLFLVLSVWVFIMIVIGFVLFRMVIRESAVRSCYQNSQSGFITESFDNVVIYKLNKCKNFFFTKFGQNQEKEDSSYRKMNILFAITRSVYGTVNILCLCGMFILIAYLKITNPGLNAVFYFIQFWISLVQMWDLMHNIVPTSFVAGKLIQSIQLLKLNTEQIAKAENITHFETLKIENLNFSYRTVPIFQQFSMTCQNQFLLINGPSGIGKSTLFNIILGLEIVDSNTIFINGKDLKSINNIYDYISVLPQRDMIFNASVRKNITLDKPYDEQKLKMIFEITKIGDFIAFNEIDEKICGPNGAQISGGQAKRIAIARMLLFDEDQNLLLLDEPFNNLSQDIIDSILDFLTSLRGFRTVLCIDHTGNFQKIADSVIAINDNMIYGS